MGQPNALWSARQSMHGKWERTYLHKMAAARVRCEMQCKMRAHLLTAPAQDRGGLTMQRASGVPPCGRTEKGPE